MLASDVRLIQLAALSVHHAGKAIVHLFPFIMVMASQNTPSLAPSLLPILTALLSVCAASASAIAATMAVRIQRRSHASDAFMRISERFESADFRKYRTMIYGLDRNSFNQWSDDEKTAVNGWCAHLDLTSVLIQSGQLDQLSFLNMYGDVVLRTIYQVAPYCNYQLGIRGKQFLLPLRMLTTDLVKLWRHQARKRKYPLTIGFPSQPHLRVNPDLFDSDDEVMKFRFDS